MKCDRVAPWLFSIGALAHRHPRRARGYDADLSRTVQRCRRGLEGLLRLRIRCLVISNLNPGWFSEVEGSNRCGPGLRLAPYRNVHESPSAVCAHVGSERHSLIALSITDDRCNERVGRKIAISFALST